MAAGNTLVTLFPGANDPGSTTAQLDARNNHPQLNYDDTTNEDGVWTAIMPQHYSAIAGVTVITWWAAASAVAGDIDVDVAFERMTGLDIDADSFATAQSTDNTSVPATAGQPFSVSVALTAGSQIDGVVAGDTFRLKVTRDATSDTAAGDVSLLGVEIRET